MKAIDKSFIIDKTYKYDNVANATFFTPSGEKLSFMNSPQSLVNTGFIRLFTIFLWKIPTI